MSAVPKPALAAERKHFYEKIDKANVTPLWEVLHGLITATPNTPCQPYLWQWDTVFPWILEAGKLITAKEAERRVLVQGMYQIIRAYISGVKMDILKSKPDALILLGKKVTRACFLERDMIYMYGHKIFKTQQGFLWIKKGYYYFFCSLPF